MKIPTTPPDFNSLINNIAKEPGKIGALLSLGAKADPQGKYHHWDKLRHLKLPSQISTHEEWWLAIKFARKALYKNIPHSDKNSNYFVYSEPDAVRRLLHEIDIHGGGELKATEQVANPSTRDTYLINSLIEESITSSQLEGAATTRKVAKEMLRQKREPRDKSETMILNNYYAMEFIKDISNEELTPELIYELHVILSKNTFDDPGMVGKLRTADDVYVGDDRDATIIHVPPKAKELASRMKSICDFANSRHPTNFLHPVLRAIILHFLLAYDHPFEDGNGRTARALFYWSMLKQGYWTIEFISISRILKLAPAKYTRAYLHTETDESDVTYFIIHQLEVINKAIGDLLEYLEKKSNEIKAAEQFIRKSSNIRSLLNNRQAALINRALKNPDAVFYIESHRGAHNVTYDTARTDLLKLVNMGFLKKTKTGKAFAFLATANLKKKLENIK
ncbi:MAG: filamentation induced by cAMP protein fic [Cycloclasticus sp. symbiont of Poecilosclerida sp. M]|nr:MAG: filamentation induced by cAMP protein fic [Cycloclasticus sp. symbiont of Poecilosclerida sp. M]